MTVRLEAVPGGPRISWGYAFSLICSGPARDTSQNDPGLYTIYAGDHLACRDGVMSRDGPWRAVGAGDIVTYRYDAPAGVLEYAVNGEAVGIVFSGLPAVAMHVGFYLADAVAIRVISVETSSHAARKV